MNVRNFTLAAAAGLACSTTDVMADKFVGFDATTQRWYQIVRVSGGIDWNTARSQAGSFSGGDLAVITSAGEQALISGLTLDASGLWIGGQQNLGSGEPAGGWNWITFEPFTYTNWNFGAPDDQTTFTTPPANEDRIIMWTAGGRWNDAAGGLSNPDFTKGFVVESTSAPAPVVWSGNGHGYMFVLYRAVNSDVMGGLTWDEANTVAGSVNWQGHTGHLMTVSSAAEWAFIKNFMGTEMRAGLWLGGQQMDAGPEPAGGWMWVTGEPWSFTSWLQGLPDDNRAFFPNNNNENRLITGSASGDWNDLSQLDNRVNDTKGLIIEFEGTVAGCGAADIGSQGGITGADGVLDNNDFVVYLDRFFANNPAADVGRQGGIPGSDGLFDNNDFIIFINLFFAGC